MLTNDETGRSVDDVLLPMLWLYDLPTWLFGLLTVLVFVVPALIGLGFVHRRIHRSELALLLDNGTIGWFFSSVTVLYGLTLGLITVATWSNFSQASSIASNESATITVLYRDLSGYKQPEQQQLRQLLKDYTAYIINKSWPIQRRGRISDGEAGLLTDFQEKLLNTEPETTGQEIIHTEAVRAFNNMVELRRQRIESVRGSVPGVLWSVVLIGAIITLISSYYFSLKNFWVHARMTGLLAGMIGLLVFLLAALDHPYWGDVSVTPESYELVLKNVMGNQPSSTVIAPPNPGTLNAGALLNETGSVK